MLDGSCVAPSFIRVTFSFTIRIGPCLSNMFQGWRSAQAVMRSVMGEDALGYMLESDQSNGMNVS